MEKVLIAVFVGAATIVLAVLLACGVRWWGRRRKAARVEINLAQARQRFHRQREWLEAKFLKLAAESGKPRGLAWADCDFENGVAFARDRETGDLRALVGVTIRFEAVEGGGMEDNPNVSNKRAATAVFRLDGQEWLTDGRAVFNLNPAETIQHFQNELEVVE